MIFESKASRQVKLMRFDGTGGKFVHLCRVVIGRHNNETAQSGREIILSLTSLRPVDGVRRLSSATDQGAT